MYSTVFTLLLCFFGTTAGGFICLFLCFMFYLHYIHKINAHLPGPPRASFIFGNLPDYWKYKKETGRILAEYVLEKRLEYGPIMLLMYLHRPVVYLGDPDYVREVFINNHKYACKLSFVYDKLGFIFGERGLGYGIVTNVDDTSWRKRRHIMNPAFHRKCLKDFMPSFNNVCNQFLIHMDKIADCGKPVSMVKEFAKVTLDTISQVSFNISTKTIEYPESPFPSAIRNYLNGAQANYDIPLRAGFLSIFQYKLFQTHSQRDQINAARFLRKFASDCITSRMRDIAENKDVPNDLLNILINDSSLTRDDIIDEFITIFIAGQETTANSMAFTLYEVLSNPHIEAKLLKEIKEVLGTRQEIVFDDLAKLKYLDQVWKENLRKHPVVFAPNRMLLKEITVGGYQIPKGNSISAGPLLFGMNPEIWKDPKIFDPERFAEVENIPNLSMIYFPFSIGPRNCIGQTFAKIESKVILAKLFQKFQFKLLPNQTDQFLGRITVTPRDGVMCEVIKCTRDGREYSGE